MKNINELEQQHNEKVLGARNLFRTDAFNPMVDLPFIYYFIGFGMDQLGLYVDEEIFTGGRMTGKTFAEVYIQMLSPTHGFLANPLASGYVVMQTQQENKIKTFREIERFLMEMNKKQWIGAMDDQITATKNNDRVAWERRWNGYFQEIIHTSIDKLGSLGGIPSLSPNGEQGGYLNAWMEELVSSTARFKQDFEKQKQNYKLVDDWKDTAIRKGVKVNDQWITPRLRWTFNSWNRNEPKVKQVVDKLEEVYDIDISIDNEWLVNHMETTGYLFLNGSFW